MSEEKVSIETAIEVMKKILKKNTKNKWIRYWELQFGKSGKNKKNSENGNEVPKHSGKEPLILRENLDDSENDYVIAKCCNPIPGDDVIGYISPLDQVIIHKSKCPTAIRLMSSHGNQIVPARWTTHKILSFLVRINLRGIDRFGVYNQITTIISKELSVNIRNINLSSHDGIFEGNIDLYVHSTADLNNLIMNLIKIKGVDKVNRVENIEE